MTDGGALCDVVVRRVVPGDWPLLRSLRLEALLDTPLAFLERHADAVGKDEREWRWRATRGSDGGDSCQLLALRDRRPVATAITFPDGAQEGVWWVAGVYVQPFSPSRPAQALTG